MSRTNDYWQSLSDPSLVEIPKLLDCLLLDAITARASDIHIEAWEDTIAVRIRINGVLSEMAYLPLELMDRLAARVRVLANLVSYQTDLPQEGRVEAKADFEGAELRVSLFPNVWGGKMVVRIFDSRHRSFDLNQLGLEEDLRDKLMRLLGRPNGLLLLTGPTGCGKTTTIYSALMHIVQRAGASVSVSTIEDPVEYRLPMISQSQINPAKDFTYATALRSLLRQDPQVIMVGEIRDADTATIALQAGLTGHLVISTIHSGSSTGVFARLMNMGLEPFLLASSVIGVLGLRLMRMNCPHCLRRYQPDAALLRSLPAEVVEKAEFTQGAGCPECMNTGFSGRAALAELLAVDTTFRDSLLQKVPTATLQEVAIRQGMQTFFQVGLRRAMQGRTTLEEVFRVVALDQL